MGYFNVVVIGAVLGAGSLLIWDDWRTHRRLETEQAAHASLRATVAQAAADSENERTRLVKERADAIARAVEASHQRRVARAHYDRDLADFAGRLRESIAAVSDPGKTGEHSAASCSERAKTLGTLLGSADARAERDARELETLNEEKRLLLESWPPAMF